SHRKLVAENDALKKMAAKFEERDGVYSILRRKVEDHNAALIEQNRALKKEAAQNTALAAENTALKRQLKDENVALKQHMDSTASQLCQARVDLDNMRILWTQPGPERKSWSLKI
ncbi:unnamed protein product, partial [Pleuronectes platessa]